MKRTRIRFLSLIEMAEFILKLETKQYYIDFPSATLFGDLKEGEIELALNSYKAALIRPE